MVCIFTSSSLFFLLDKKLSKKKYTIGRKLISPTTGLNSLQLSVNRNAQSDHQGYSSDVNKQQNSRSSPRPASSRLMMFPVFRQSNIKRVEVGKSHSSSLSSLGDVKVSEVRSSEVQAGGRRVFSQVSDIDGHLSCISSSKTVALLWPVWCMVLPSFSENELIIFGFGADKY